MSESKLRELSMDFSVDIINLVKYLKSNHETIIANQIGRSGTSIGANIREAQYAHGTPTFISRHKKRKMFLCLKIISNNFCMPKAIEHLTRELSKQILLLGESLRRCGYCISSEICYNTSVS